jgi:hypothetical protein
MKNKSWPAVALLRYIAHHEVSIDYLRKIDNRYARSLLNDGFLARKGTQLFVTSEGYDFLANYTTAKPVSRLKESDLSKSVQSLLHVARLKIIRKAS